MRRPEASFLLLASVFAVATAAPCSAQELPIPPLVERRDGAEPPFGEERTSLPGDPVYVEFDYPVQVIALAESEIRYSRNLTIPANEPVGGYRAESGREVFCSNRQRQVMHGGGIVCLRDDDGDGAFDRFSLQATDKLAARSMKVDPPVPYELERMPIQAERTSDSSGRFLRREILYQGAARGVLHLRYREFVDDLAREAFSQDLSFDLAAEEATALVVKGARLEVLSAGK